jgi:predicted dehydrogenase
MIVDTIRVGVIGCGYWGPNLIRNFVESSRAELVGVADLRQERLEHIQKRYPAVNVTQDYRDLLTSNLDAVVVATPPDAHYMIARKCLEHNLSVLVEKPLTLSSHDAQDLVDLADQAEQTLMVGHTFEFNAGVRALRRLIQSNELGDIFYINSVRVNLGLFQRNLNVIWDLAPHDISILLYILGQEPLRVCANGACNVVEGLHDIAFLHLEFPDNILAHVHISWLDPCKIRRITVVGSKKMAVFDDVEPVEKIKIYDKGVEYPPYTNTFDEFKLSYRNGDVYIPQINFQEPLRTECDHFIDAVIKNQQPSSCGRCGLSVVNVLEALDHSLMNNGEFESIEGHRGHSHEGEAA